MDTSTGQRNADNGERRVIAVYYCSYSTVGRPSFDISCRLFLLPASMCAKEVRESADSGGAFLNGQGDEVRHCDDYVDGWEGWTSPPDRFLRPMGGRRRPTAGWVVLGSGGVVSSVDAIALFSSA
ncbi:hypothetical protein FRAHR75_2010004 [Frankia sp. Hr75.2]|nr:hypothetical protein FRAHR75_2010004 [Frankia sp. Hr75.2]